MGRRGGEEEAGRLLRACLSEGGSALPWDRGQGDQSPHISKGKGNTGFSGKSPHVTMLADIFLKQSLAEGQSHTHAASLLNKSSPFWLAPDTQVVAGVHAPALGTHRASAPKPPHQRGLTRLPTAERKIMPSSGRAPIRAQVSTPRGISVRCEPYATLYPDLAASFPGLL